MTRTSLYKFQQVSCYVTWVETTLLIPIMFDPYVQSDMWTACGFQHCSMAVIVGV